MRRLCVEQANADGMCSFWLLSAPVVTLVRAASVKRALVASMHREKLPVLTRHLDMFLGPKALVTLMGREWRFHRSVVARAFSQTAMRGKAKLIASVADVLVQSIEARINDENNNM